MRSLSKSALDNPSFRVLMARWKAGPRSIGPRILSGVYFSQRLGRFGAAYRRQLLGREHAVDIQDHDELRVALPHALDKVGPDLGADPGRRLNLFRLQVDHLLDRVRQGADHGRFALKQHRSEEHTS